MKSRTISRAMLAAATLGILGSLTWGSQVEAAKETFNRSKPHVSFSTKAEGVDMAGFQQLEGMGVEIEVIEYQDGDDPVLRKRPGRVKYGDITLERPYTGATDVQEWANEAARSKAQRRDVTIVMLDPSATTVREFTLIDCFPSSWELATDDKGLVIEKIELAVERVEMAE